MRRIASRVLLPGIMVLTLLAGPASPRARGATLPPIMARMLKAMVAATAYKMVNDSTTSGGSATVGGASTVHMTMIRLGRGASAHVYIESASKRAGAPPRVSEVIYTGTHICERQNGVGAWNCAYPLSDLPAMISGDPAKALQSLGAHFQIASIGRTRKELGQTCALYTFTETLTSVVALTMHGTYCINPTTALPVEVNSIVSEVLLKGQPAFVTKGTQIYSHWNDATLTIPTVPQT